MKKLLYPLYSIVLMACSLVMVACGGNKEESPAAGLYSQAETAFQTGNFPLAIELLDSLQRAFPAEVELQRKGMALRPQVIEKQTLNAISTNDSLMALAKVEAERLQPQLKWVKTPRMLEGYWVAAQGYNPDFMNSTAIQGRVSEIGEFYIVSSMKPAGNHTSISLSAGSEKASTPTVPYDGESNYRIDGGEIITFSPLQSDTIGDFASAHRGQPLTLSFNGKTSKSVKLTAPQVDALANLYAYSKAVVGARDLNVERQRLEAVLQVARAQIARTSPDEATDPTAN